MGCVQKYKSNDDRRSATEVAFLLTASQHPAAPFRSVNFQGTLYDGNDCPGKADPRLAYYFTPVAVRYPDHPHDPRSTRRSCGPPSDALLPISEPGGHPRGRPRRQATRCRPSLPAIDTNSLPVRFGATRWHFRGDDEGSNRGHCGSRTMGATRLATQWHAQGWTVPEYTM